MLADDEVLLDELGEEAQHNLEAAGREALTDIDPNDRSGPTDVATNPAQVFRLASCSCFDCVCVQVVPKHKMSDGREVSWFGGGAKNPDGSLKKQKMPAGEVVGRKKGCDKASNTAAVLATMVFSGQYRELYLPAH